MILAVVFGSSKQSDMGKKLYYFNVPALAESIRYVLHYTKQEFEDVRYDFNTWPDMKIKESLPYAQFPIYEEGGKTLYQSIPIIQYVARDSGLIPEDPWQRAQVDSYAHTIYDYWANIRNYILEQEPERKEALKKKVFDEVIDFYLSRFERDLKANGGYFVGKLSWAEFILAGLIDSTNAFLRLDEVQKDYPTISARVQEIHSLPGVKEYIAARGPYDIKV